MRSAFSHSRSVAPVDELHRDEHAIADDSRRRGPRRRSDATAAPSPAPRAPASLAARARAAAAVGVGLQQLDRDLAIELGIERRVDDAHAALADHVEDDVTANDAAAIEAGDVLVERPVPLALRRCFISAVVAHQRPVYPDNLGLHVRVARDGVQRPDGHRVLVLGTRAARRREGPARRWLGPRALRRQRGALVPRAARRGEARRSRRYVRAESDQDAARDRARPQAHARRGHAREHPSVRARAVGTELDVRAQRHGQEAEAPRARPVRADRQHRQRARVLRAARGAPARSFTTYPKTPAQAVARRSRSCRRDRQRRHVQLPARRRPLPLRALRDEARAT